MRLLSHDTEHDHPGRSVERIGTTRSERERDRVIGRCLRTLLLRSSPDLEDILGSNNWDNMVHQRFVVHRPKFVEDGERQTEAEFLHRKAPASCGGSDQSVRRTSTQSPESGVFGSGVVTLHRPLGRAGSSCQRPRAGSNHRACGHAANSSQSTSSVRRLGM